MADSLQDELLSIPGIASAEFEGSQEHPVGVRVQLAVGADPNEVGQAVQRVLASHGMRSQVAHEESESFLPAGSVVNLSDYENQPVEDRAEPEPDAATAEADVEVMPGPPPAVEVPEVEVGAATPDASGDEDDLALESAEPEVAVTEEPTPAAPEPQPSAGPVSIAGVGVDEDGTRLRVSVSASDGRVATRSVPATPHGLDDAAARAAVELAAPDTMPRVVAVVDGAIEGAPLVTVMLEGVAGRRFAGSSVVQGSRAYAVARATWAALQN